MRRERRELWPSADTAPPAAKTVGFDIGFPFGFGAGASGARQHAFRGRVSRREGQLEMPIRYLASNGTATDAIYIGTLILNVPCSNMNVAAP
jgi:hypothetical protein